MGPTQTLEDKQKKEETILTLIFVRLSSATKIKEKP
jgi:hypothetical protein